MSKFIVQEIHVRRFYGRPFLNLRISDLKPGFNAVFGTNGAGKSTLGRGFSHLISPTTGRDRLVGARVSISDGIPTSVDVVRPEDATWPKSVRPDLYRVEISELVTQLDGHDRSAVTKAMEGGVDLDRLPINWITLQSVGVPPEKPVRQAEMVAQDEALLPGLRIDLESHRNNNNDYGHIQTLLKRVERRIEREAVEKEIDEIERDHPGVDKQTADAVTVAEHILSDLESKERELNDVETTLCERFGGPPNRDLSEEHRVALDVIEQDATHYKDVRSQAENTLRHSIQNLRALGGDPDTTDFKMPTDADVEQACELDSQISDWVRRVDDATLGFNAASAAVTEASRKIASITRPADSVLEALTAPPSISTLADDVRAFEADLRGQTSAYDRALGRANAAAGNAEHAQMAIDYLSAWIRGQAYPAQRLPGPLLWIVGATSLVVAFGVAYAVGPWPGLIIAAIGLFVVAWIAGRPSNVAAQPTEQLRPAEEQVPKEFNPVDWTIPAVIDAILKVSKKKAIADGCDQVVQDTTPHPDANLEAKKSDLNQRIGLFKQTSGVHIEDPYFLAYLVESLIQVSKLEATLRATEDNLRWSCKQREDLISTRRILLNGQAETGQDLRALRNAWRAYFAARKALDETLTKIVEIEDKVRQIQVTYGVAWDKHLEMLTSFREWFTLKNSFDSTKEKVDSLQIRLNDHLNEKGIPDGEGRASRMDILRARVIPAEKHAEKIGMLLEKRANENALTPDKDAMARYKLSHDSDLVTINRVLQTLQPSIEEHERIQNRITTIETLVHQATVNVENSPYPLEVAQCELRVARVTKTLVLDSVCRFIRSAVADQDTPAIIQHANLWLERFTNRRYSKLTIRNNAVFVVDELDEERVKEFAELSTGSKVHLALAIRLAAIETSEQETVFPVVFDEVMATSDENASEAIAQALAEISKSRQVILLTNQADDIQRVQLHGANVVSINGASVPVFPPLATGFQATSIFVDGNGLPLSTPVRHWPARKFENLVDIIGLEHARGEDVLPEQILRVLEEMRLLVAPAHRRLDWETAAQLDGVTDNMRDRIKDAFVKSEGHPRTFLNELQHVKGLQDRTKTRIEQALSAGGFLHEAPTLEDLLRLSSSAAEIKDSHEKLASLFLPYLTPHA